MLMSQQEASQFDHYDTKGMALAWKSRVAKESLVLVVAVIFKGPVHLI
jgi:hypothetical protein